jgi:tripartite-type tricarboxylate transporter receptor subunit TctC
MTRAIIGGLAAILLGVVAAGAQGNYPSHQVQIVVPFPPGGNTDILARVMADQYSTAFRSR